jgi:hypothetical protein
VLNSTGKVGHQQRYLLNTIRYIPPPREMTIGLSSRAPSCTPLTPASHEPYRRSTSDCFMPGILFSTYSLLTFVTTWERQRSYQHQLIFLPVRSFRLAGNVNAIIVAEFSETCGHSYHSHEAWLGTDFVQKSGLQPAS